MFKRPSSLMWLMRKHARLNGEIQAIKKKREKDDARLRQLEQDLAAITATLAQHEVLVDPADIRPKAPRSQHRILPHGDAMRYTLDCLRLNRGHFVSTDDVLAHVVKRSGLVLSPELTTALRATVRDNLKKKAKEGLVEPQHEEPGTNGGFGMGYWRLR